MGNLLKLLGLLVLMTACSPLDLLTTAGSLVGGGGGNSGISVPIDAQIGKENTKQVVGTQETTTVAGNQSVSTGAITAEEVTVIESPKLWFIILLILGWLAPSPGEMGRGLRRIFTRR